ncbi:MAG: methionyl-tRNA formyltransferase [Deltaproteobacteria bacterium]|nr:methionyl-tRNA formyltransferase [Deltaproteobacteria bacterium]
MKIVFFGKGTRGLTCLKALLENSASVILVIGMPGSCDDKSEAVTSYALEVGIPVLCPEDNNNPAFIEELSALSPDLFVLAGYGKIFREKLISVPSLYCLNLHGGRLPQYRGSSPLNWALINGESSFGLSIIKVDGGIDTGDVVLQRSFPIGPNDSIKDLHDTANAAFPEMLLEVMEQIRSNKIVFKKQCEEEASYYPLRFSDDGLIIWDMLTAEEIHNRIRALTTPYPGAFTYYCNRRVNLYSSELLSQNYFGEAGRVYKKDRGKMLVCAKDKCLWIKQAQFEDSRDEIYGTVKRYQKFITTRDQTVASIRGIA